MYWIKTHISLPKFKSLLILFVVLFGYLSSYGQDEEEEKLTKKGLKKENEAIENGYTTKKVNKNLLVQTGSKEDYFFEFNNINKVDRYVNHGQRKKIEDLQQRGDEGSLIRALEEYIASWGIRNFSEETDLLWMLAQLYEKNEMIDKAKAAYRLVLKHHRTEVVREIQQYFKIRNHYDELTELEKDYYVPLDYYYELVEYRKQIDTLHPPRSVLLNMGSEINERKVADYGPSISMRDDFMLFTKKMYDTKHTGIKSKYSEDLYYSKLEDGLWSESVRFPPPINSSCNEGSACLSSDGRTLYFTRCRIPECKFDCFDCQGDCDLFVTHMGHDGFWSMPKNLGPEVNSINWDSHPSLSKHEDTLFFASDRKGGFGLSDIWFTYKLKKDKWAPAQNLGPVVNTRDNEQSPFVNRKHNVFFFSSNGQILNFDDLDNSKNFRTLDIYKVHRTNGRFNEPQNIGPLVNGEGDEFYFTMDSQTKDLFYAKSEQNTNDNKVTDLFSFPVPMEAQPMAIVTLSGMLIDEETGNPYQGIVSVIDLDNGIEVAPKKVREDGSYDFDLINHNNYLLIVQGDEFFRIEKLFYLDGDTSVTTEARSVRNKKLQFSSIVFSNGKWDILPEMEKDLWDVINFLVDNPEFSLSIGGHTDSDGNRDANMRLSQNRADAIKEFIIKKGYINPDRILAKGYGDTKPIRSPEVTDEDKRINRRVEFEILYQKDEEEENPFGDTDFNDDSTDPGEDGW